MQAGQPQVISGSQPAFEPRVLEQRSPMYCKSNVVHACLLPISAQCLALQTFPSGTFTVLFGGWVQVAASISQERPGCNAPR